MASALTIHLPRADYCYDILIQPGILNDVNSGLAIKQRLPQIKKLLIVTHEALWQLHGQSFSHVLTMQGFSLSVHTVPEGEPTKSLEQLNGIWLAAQQAGLTRKDAFVAFGGGVIGDLTGFAASAYYRGVPFVQVPTTLLSQVDSSVGGKTGINAGPVKNSVGAFYQPALVLIDPSVLTTLPEREITAGLAEVAKYALIESSCTGQSAELWQLLNRYADRAALLTDIGPVIEHCCRIKAAVVAQDETEQSGLRALLNLGHTFGHALEADGQYTTYLHGEAVAIGTVWACQLAEQLGFFKDLSSVLTLWNRLGLPVSPWGSHQADNLLARMRQDKKNTSGQQITLILLKGSIGYVETVHDIDSSVLQDFLANQLAHTHNH